ncbi:MAG: hypothetical protein DBP02_15145 [gamma proteobacterium symbiont of Ctena orbiculata]|nr:MAG: hypothetical protein DBP02_15145 [gamma proteobacterium symbiont of Ctena orbiculata]
MSGKVKKYFRNVFVAFDQLFNALTGGDEDETISSRLGKARRNGSRFATVICWVLTHVFFWEKGDHCARSIEEDEGANEIVKF